MLLILCLASFVFTACGDDNGKNSNAPSNNGSDNPTPPPHEHTFVEGKCECGAEDPDYDPPHEHRFVDGRCECGAIEEKIEAPADARLFAYYNFNEDFGEGFTETSTCSTIERVIPPGKDNAALHITKTATDATDRFFFSAGGKVTDAKEITISYSIKLNSTFSGLLLQTLFTDALGTTPYNLTIRTAANGFTFGELPGEATLTQKYSYDAWHSVELKMTFGDDGSFLAIITVDGAEAARSASFASSASGDAIKPSREISRMGLYWQKGATLDVYIDDVLICVK